MRHQLRSVARENASDVLFDYFTHDLSPTHDIGLIAVSAGFLQVPTHSVAYYIYAVYIVAMK